MRLFSALRCAVPVVALWAAACAPQPAISPTFALTAPPLLGPGARDESPSWAARAMKNCGTGYSGPTMNPGDAIRQAQAAALGSFAEAEGVHVETVTVDTGDHVSSVSTLVSEAVLKNVRVVAVETQRTGRSDDAAARVTHALACRVGSEPSGLVRNAPAWVIDPRGAAGATEVCAVGISGPTLEPSDAQILANRDGARALAAIRSVNVKRTSADYSNEYYVILRSDAEVPESAVEDALQSSKEREHWVDDEGRGPLALPRSTFVLRCASR